MTDVVQTTLTPDATQAPDDTLKQAAAAVAAEAEAANPELLATQAPVIPRVMAKPSLKAATNKSPYVSALDAMMHEFCGSYISDTMTAEEKEQTLTELTDTVNMLRGLCDHWLRPLCERPQMGGAAVPAVSTQKTPKALSNWQIFLKYAKDRVPGHAESTDKMGLCKEYYKTMTEQDHTDLRTCYELENPNAVAAAAAAAASRQTGGRSAKGKRQTGFTLFAKDWYAAFKLANPGSSGLQSSLCSDAWKALPESERDQWKALAKQ